MSAIIDPERLVGVAAGELDEWAWLMAHVADWLAHAGPAASADHRRFTEPCGPRLEDVAWTLGAMSERMRALARRGR